MMESKTLTKQTKREGVKTNSDSLLLTHWQQHLKSCCWKQHGGDSDPATHFDIRKRLTAQVTC